MTALNSDENNCSKETMQELKDIVSFQNDLIGKLNEKLKVFDEIVIEKNDLQKSVNEFELWREKNDVFRKKVFDELMSSFEDQSEMLKKANCAKSDWQAKHNKLEDVHDCITDQFKSLKSQKNNLEFKLEDSEQNVKRLQKELRYTKLELEETNCTVGKLWANLNSYEIECRQKRKQLDENAQVNNQLKEANCTLETDIKCTREKLQNAKLCASRMEEKWNLERETLSNELKTKCKTLDDLKIQYNEANTTINEQACKIKALLTTLKDVKQAGLTKYEEMKCLVQKLQEEFTRRENNLIKLQNINKQMKQDNELIVRELNSQKDKIKEIRERQLNELQLLSKNLEQLKQKSCNAPCVEKLSINTYRDTSMESIADEYCTSSKFMQAITQKYMPKPNTGNCIQKDLTNVQSEIETLNNDIDQIFKIYYDS